MTINDVKQKMLDELGRRDLKTMTLVEMNAMSSTLLNLSKVDKSKYRIAKIINDNAPKTTE